MFDRADYYLVFVGANCGHGLCYFESIPRKCQNTMSFAHLADAKRIPKSGTFASQSHMTSMADFALHVPVKEIKMMLSFTKQSNINE